MCVHPLVCSSVFTSPLILSAFYSLLFPLFPTGSSPSLAMHVVRLPFQYSGVVIVHKYLFSL